MPVSSRPGTAGARPGTAGGSRGVPQPLDVQTLSDVHKALLGVPQDMPAPWCCGFTFRDGGMRCGLRQCEGGPCGVLAAVQAFILREVLKAADGAAVDFASVSPEAAGEAKVAALGHIIWAARVGRVARRARGARAPRAAAAKRGGAARAPPARVERHHVA